MDAILNQTCRDGAGRSGGEELGLGYSVKSL